MEDCCLCLRLPTLPFEASLFVFYLRAVTLFLNITIAFQQNECSTKEPSSPDSGFSSDDSSSSSPLMRPKRYISLF